ncbi:MAG: DUF2283 domain-containing protein [Desulfobacteraceae bacterium]|nr:DUF2283 domain-containing protein [Desulfobacteraceae bacterium]
MDKNLTFRYDRQGDILYINTCQPYSEQESEEIGDEIVARMNPKTGEIENIEVLFFSTRLLRTEMFALPITAHFDYSSLTVNKAA